MTVQFGCPCGRSHVVGDERRGSEKKCPDCGRLLIVPQTGGGLAQEAGAPSSEAAPVAPVAPAGAPSLPTKACPKCGARIAVSALACRHCGAFLDAMSDAVSEKVRSGAQDRGGEGLPCERPDVPFWTGMFQTLRMVWLEPRNAFGSLAASPDLGRAIIFAALFGGIGAAVSQIWQLALQETILKMFPAQMAAQANPMTVIQAAIGAFLSPFVIVVGSFIGAGLTHLGLLLTGATRRDYTTTAAIYLYVGGAMNLLGLIPCCGPLVGVVWGPILLVLALVWAHGAETWQAIIALLWPFLLCCCAGVGLPMLLGKLG